MTEIYKPHAYQRRAKQFLLDKKFANFWLDMGLGKTSVALTAIEELRFLWDIRAALVVAPIRVIENVWPEEAAKWRHLTKLKLVPIRGSARQRRIALETHADVYLINYELLIWLAEELDDMDRPPWDMVVFDESTKMKAHGARRFKKFRRWSLAAKRRVCMTGSPRPNTYLDLWAQTYLLDGGDRLMEFFTHYRDRWFEHNPWTHETKIRKGADKAIEARIRDITLCMRSEDYLELPPVVYNSIKVALPPKAMALYREFEKEMFVKLAGGEVEAESAATLSMRCRQLTSGAVYYQEHEDAPRKVVLLHEAKLDALEDVIEEANGESVLVVYEFKHELMRLLKRWPKTRWIGGGCTGAKASIDAWNARKVPLMFVHPASVGHGINLQHGGRIMVWTSGTWSYEQYAQMVKRLHRQGQAQAVIVHMLVATGTVDETVLATLREKKTGQDALLDALKTRAKLVLAAQE